MDSGTITHFDRRGSLEAAGCLQNSFALLGFFVAVLLRVFVVSVSWLDRFQAVRLRYSCSGCGGSGAFLLVRG